MTGAAGAGDLERHLSLLPEMPLAQAAYGAAIAGLAQLRGSKAAATAIAAAARGATQGAGAAPCPYGAVDRGVMLDRLEEVLVAVQFGAGLPAKPSLSRAKELLRDRGGQALAARLSRLSKARNSAAHADVGLPKEVECYLSDTSSTGKERNTLHEELLQDKSEDDGESEKDGFGEGLKLGVLGTSCAGSFEADVDNSDVQYIGDSDVPTEEGLDVQSADLYFELVAEHQTLQEQLDIQVLETMELRALAWRLKAEIDCKTALKVGTDGATVVLGKDLGPEDEAENTLERSNTVGGSSDLAAFDNKSIDDTIVEQLVDINGLMLDLRADVLSCSPAAGALDADQAPCSVVVVVDGAAPVEGAAGEDAAPPETLSSDGGDEVVTTIDAAPPETLSSDGGDEVVPTIDRTAAPPETRSSAGSDEVATAIDSMVAATELIGSPHELEGFVKPSFSTKSRRAAKSKRRNKLRRSDIAIDGDLEESARKHGVSALRGWHLADPVAQRMIREAAAWGISSTQLSDLLQTFLSAPI